MGGYQIVHLEMLNILVALCMWGRKWLKRRIGVHCDNQVVVMVINSGKTRNPILAAITKNIAMLTATLYINLKTVHIPGKLNVVTDALSRLSTHPQYRAHLYKLIPCHTWLEPPVDVLHIDWSI